jgi:hypothetical protein
MQVKQPGWFSRRVAQGGPEGAGQKARSGTPARERVLTRVEHSVTTTWLPSRRKKRKTTVEWRHGNCPVRHRSQEAALRCKRT